jgi:hypothetical protein
MILSEEARATVLQLESGFFLDRALVGPDRFEVQFIVKASFEIISAVRHGSKMFLWSGLAGDRDRVILAATFTVEDDRDASFYLSRTLNPDQRTLLATFFNDRRGHVIFFDELNRALLTAKVSVSQQPYLERAKALLSRHIEEPNETQIAAALDDVEARACTAASVAPRTVIPAGATPTPWQASSWPARTLACRVGRRSRVGRVRAARLGRPTGKRTTTLQVFVSHLAAKPRPLVCPTATARDQPGSRGW